jgi:ribosome-binding ATPase
MSLSIGIIGLPNVGKSTLFNALLKKQAALAANYPFATIEPNIGIVDVPDPRIEGLNSLVRAEHDKDPDKVVPATVKFVDIAGLVKGASQGEGLGNKFLSHIREVDAIIHVLRVFEDDNIARAGSTNPSEDKEVINTELILADLETLSKRIQVEEGPARTDKEAAFRLEVYKKVRRQLDSGNLAAHTDLTPEEKQALSDIHLITAKPVMHVFNVSEDAFLEGTKLDVDIPGAYICAQLESDLAGLSEQDRQVYMDELGIEEPGLNKIIRKGYALLNLQTFFTYGPKEVHAWTVVQGATAPEAAGRIHSDFQRGFINAQVISYDILFKVGGWKAARDKGLVRSEGKEYVMAEGDVVEFRFSV